MSSKKLITPLPKKTDGLHLTALLGQVSEALQELSDTCIDLQTIHSTSEMGMDADQVVRAQALDRVTQSLACLSTLNAALSTYSSLQDIMVSQQVVNAIKLPSVRTILENPAALDNSELIDIELF